MSEMLKEALESPEKVRHFLAQDAEMYARLGASLRQLDPAVVGTIARGSSDHAAAYAKYLLPLCTGRVVASLPPSVVTLLQAPLRLQGQFVLAISQSGGSPDIVQSLECARKNGALTAALVNQTNSPLAKVADWFLSQHAGAEISITATKTVLCTLTAIARLAAEWGEEKSLLTALAALPETLARAAQVGMKLDASLLEGVDHIYVLSRGLGFSAALEVALKLKETCGIHAEAFSAAEVRHGPREIVGKNFLVIALALPGAAEESVLRAAQDLEAQGARLLVVGPPGAHVPLPDAGDPRLTALSALQLLYPWIARASVALGRNPDQPRTLQGKVILTT